MQLSLNKKNNDIKNQNLSTPKISLPYIKGTTDKITKILNKHNINVAFTPANTIKKAMQLSLNKKNNDIKNQNLSTPKISLPYIKGTTDKISKILNKHNINVPFTPTNTITQLFNSIKDPINPKLQKGVYVIPCSCGKEYIGETGRSLNIRLKNTLLT